MKNLIPVFILLIALSCTDTAPVSPRENAVLRFKDANEIFSYVKNKNEGSFESFNDVFQEATKKLAEAKTEAEHTQLLETYRDVVILADDTYKPTLSNSVYRAIINRDRLYIAGEHVHKVLNDQHIVYTKEENINALRRITSLDGLNQEIFKVASYQDTPVSPDDARTAASCGPTHQKDYFHNESNCRNDRRVWVRAHAFYAISGNNYTPSVISEAWGELRRGTWCNWAQYHTRLSVRNCSFTVYITINGTNASYTFTNTDLPDHTSDGDVYDYTIWNGPVLGGPITWTGGAIPTIEFSAIHEEATSRGVGETNWAVIDCQ
jgi:hypothetical protein